MNRLPMREKIVNRYLDKVTSNLFARNDSYSFRQRLQELNQLRMVLKHQEQEVYKMFNVKDINELNERIQKYEGLARLGGANLSKYLDSLNFEDDNDLSLDYIFQQVIDSKIFRNIVDEKTKKQANWEGIRAEVLEELVKSLKTQKGINFRMPRSTSTKKGKTFGLDKILRSITIDAGKVKFKSLSKKEFSSEFITRIQQAFLDCEIVEEEDRAIAELTLTDQNRSKYAGWKYTIDQVKDNPILESQLRDKILQLCLKIMQGNSQEEWAFRKAFQKMPTESLLVYNVSNIQGAIGEVALGAYVELLTNGQNGGVQVGDVRNSLNHNGQISVDFLLSNYGFQVKNYNEFSYGLPNSIVLSRTNLLSVWQEKFDMDELLSEMLNIFYGIRWYNIEYNADYSDTQQRILRIEQNLGDFYARYPDKILRLYEDIHGASLFNTKILQGRFYNTFYFVSGKKFIPSSEIIQKIIDYFEVNFEPNSSITQEVYTSSSYHGFNIVDFKDAGKYEQAPKLSEVASKVKVQINWRLTLDDFFK